MLGETVAVGDDLWLVRGGRTEGSDHFPEVPNVLLYRCGGRLTLMDSGYGRKMRAALRALFAQVGPAGSFTLLNSHGHATQVANNDLIQEAPAPTQAKRHYLSRPGMALLDPRSYLAQQYTLLSDYFDPLDRLREAGWEWRLAAVARDLLAPLVGEKRTYRWLVPLALERLEPYGPSPETIRFFEDLPRQTIEIGGVAWDGWALEEEGVWVLPDRGHSPDHVLFYLPGEQLVHAGHLTFPIFNRWPDGDAAAIRSALERLLQMVEAGAVEVLTGAHEAQPLRGREPIRFFLQRLLADDRAFRQVLAELVRADPGSTIPELYRGLQARREPQGVVDRYFQLVDPRAPGSMQAVIALSLLAMGCRCEGVQRQNRFFLPSRG